MEMRASIPNKRWHDPKLSYRQTHPDANESIELTAQRKRDLLAAVGFLDEDDELPEVHLAGSSVSNTKLASNGGDDDEYYHEREERRQRKQRMKNENMIDFDEAELLEYDDEEDEHHTNRQYYDDNNLYCSRDDEYHSQCSDDEQPSPRGKCCYITTKLLYILLIVVAFNYIFGDDLTTPDNSEQEPIKQEYFSYKGYKDGRIPDDDSLLRGEDFDNSSSDGASFEDGHDTKNNLDLTSFEAENSMDASFHKHKTGVPDEDSLWKDLAGYADISEPYNPSSSDIAFFWHIPKCGGTTLQDLMMHCLGMVGANEVGGTYVNNGPLQIVQLDNGNRYVNVDVSQPDGIQHAHDLGFASSGLADVALSSRFHNAAILFTPNDSAQSDVAKGRCFTLLRHPVKRAISMFYYLRSATWENTYNKIYQNMTIEEYAISQYAEDNWIVRFLTNEMTGALSDKHLDLAKQILQSKCLVGLLDEFAESLKRFNAYFKWDQTDFDGGPVQMNDRSVCEARVTSKPDNVHAHPNFDEGSEVWKLLMEKNILDLGLYEYAVDLFHNVQANLIA